MAIDCEEHPCEQNEHEGICFNDFMDDVLENSDKLLEQAQQAVEASNVEAADDVS